MKQLADLGKAPRIRSLIASEGKPLGYVATRDLTPVQ